VDRFRKLSEWIAGQFRAIDDEQGALRRSGSPGRRAALVLIVAAFGLVTPQCKMDRYAVPVTLPRAGEQEIVIEKGVPVVVVDSQGQLIWLAPDTAQPQRQIVDEAELQKRLEEFASRHPHGTIRLQAATETPYKRVVELMDLAKRAKVHEVKLETQPRSAP